jgi:hypothetical protein
MRRGDPSLLVHEGRFVRYNDSLRSNLRPTAVGIR